MTAWSVYTHSGLKISDGAILNQRVWKGEDATYFVLELDQHAYRQPPVAVAQSIFIYALHAHLAQQFTVREIVMDQRKMAWTVSCIDIASWEKAMRLLPMPKPPKFATVEEADAWLEQHGG